MYNVIVTPYEEYECIIEVIIIIRKVRKHIFRKDGCLLGCSAV
jgi:hypothetical protein